MNEEEARKFWERSVSALRAAKRNLSIDPNTTANRAYYAAFYAAAALFTAEGATFKRHSVLESLVHRDLVKPGRWSVELGADYRFLRRLRSTGDYDVFAAVSLDDAKSAVDSALRILRAVCKEHPDLFGAPP